MNDTVPADDRVKCIFGVWQVLRVALTTLRRRHVAVGSSHHGLREVKGADLGSSLRSGQGQHAVARADIEGVAPGCDTSSIKRNLGRLRGQWTNGPLISFCHLIPS